MSLPTRIDKLERRVDEALRPQRRTVVWFTRLQDAPPAHTKDDLLIKVVYDSNDATRSTALA